MDEEYWAAYRKRMRERAARQGFLILGPVIILGALIGIIDPIWHPDGDIRGDPVFRLVTLGLLIAFALFLMVASVRWLREDRRK